MFQGIANFVSEHREYFIEALVGGCMIASYLTFGRRLLEKKYNVKLNERQNMLETSFQELIKENKRPGIVKIVLTQADQYEGEFRGMVIEEIKKTFLRQNVGVLINCAPRKLFDAGCDLFWNEFRHKDPEYVDYLIGFLTTELIIEDTIQKIDFVSQMKEKAYDFSVMICDDNCLDIRRMTKSEKCLSEVFEKLQITEEQLYDLYQVVVHLQGPIQQQKQFEILDNNRIEEMWKNPAFKGSYRRFRYCDDEGFPAKENVKPVIQFIKSEIFKSREE